MDFTKVILGPILLFLFSMGEYRSAYLIWGQLLIFFVWGWGGGTTCGYMGVSVASQQLTS